jgi:hypothetical protein
MVKAKIRENLLIGLSFKNLELLKKGHPIKFQLSDLGIPGDYTVLIFAGETEQSMTDMLKDSIDPVNTIIKDERYKAN